MVISGIPTPPILPPRKPSDGIESLPIPIRKLVVGLGHFMNLHEFGSSPSAQNKFKDGATKLIMAISDEMVDGLVDAVITYDP